MTNVQHAHSQPTAPCCPELYAEVAQSAYRLYEQHGSRDGRDVQNWLEAEAHVKARHATDKHAHHHSNASGSASAR